MPAFEKGTESAKEVAVPGAGADPIKGLPIKARKTVVGLFDSKRASLQWHRTGDDDQQPFLPGSILAGLYHVENHHLRSSRSCRVRLQHHAPRPLPPLSPCLTSYQPSPSKSSQDLEKTPQKPSLRMSDRHRLCPTPCAQGHTTGSTGAFTTSHQSAPDQPL
jgi:hypothetical protein